MKSRMMMAALVLTLLVGARTYAGDCGPCDPACDPCGACDGCSKVCDLFSGLKNLAACEPATGDCGPCDGVVACTPCDNLECDPCGSCGDLGCNTDCGRKFSFGKRLKRFFADKSCNPCDEVACDVDPCDALCDADGCDPCDDLACDTACVPQFKFKNLFSGFKFGRCGTGCDDPCAGACDLGCDDDAACDPCDEAACDPCADCDTSCGRKFGRLFDKPRRSLKNFFEGCFDGGCNTGCDPCDAAGPCDNIACDPCMDTCDFASKLPEAVN